MVVLSRAVRAMRSGALSVARLMVCLAGVCACGGVARVPPTADAEVAAVAGASGAGATPDLDALPAIDAGSELDAGEPEQCPPPHEPACCDLWTGERAMPTCINGIGQCGSRQVPRPLFDECVPIPAVCQVESVAELDGKACSPEVPSCGVGSGCSSCQCACPEDTRVWVCLCNAC